MSRTNGYDHTDIISGCCSVANHRRTFHGLLYATDYDSCTHVNGRSDGDSLFFTCDYSRSDLAYLLWDQVDGYSDAGPNVRYFL
jgi:hypothetical protein